MASRASSRASLRSFFVFDFVIDGTFPGLAMIVLKPSILKHLSIQRQWVPVSNTTGQLRSNFANVSPKPSFVVAQVVSTMMRLSPSGIFCMTQIFEVRSLTSTPIVVEYSMAVPFPVVVWLLHLLTDECVLLNPL